MAFIFPVLFSVYLDRINSLESAAGSGALFSVLVRELAGKSHVVTAADPGLKADIGSVAVGLGPHAEGRETGRGQRRCQKSSLRQA